MAWLVDFARSFVLDEKKVPRELKKRNIKAVRKVMEDPYSGKPLHGRLKGLWRVQVGKYRKIYKLEPEKNLVEFIALDLRKRVYR